MSVVQTTKDLPDSESLNGQTTSTYSVDDSASCYLGSTALQSTVEFGTQPTRSLYIGFDGAGPSEPRRPFSIYEIPVYANGSLLYLSKSKTEDSGNRVLCNTSRKALIESIHHSAPWRNSSLRIINATKSEYEIKISGSLTSHDKKFYCDSPPISFEWKYGQEKREILRGTRTKIKKINVLRLEMQSPGSKNTIRIASIDRGRNSRNSGLASMVTGIQGEIVINDRLAEENGISESLIVSSCLMMLKIELTRQKMGQVLASGSAGAPGGG
jgi:hypothetical protein